MKTGVRTELDQLKRRKKGDRKCEEWREKTGKGKADRSKTLEKLSLSLSSSPKV